MALEGWEPLDLSAFNAARSSKKPLADYIMANMQFTPLDQIALDLENRKKGAPHDVGILPRIFNLLSTPRYTLANAVDESLGGHQADPNDSVMKDALTTVGGVVTGGAKGFWSGLRGTFGTDAAASDPTDMTSFSDVLTKRGSYREYFKDPKGSIEALKRNNPGMTDEEAVNTVNDMFRNQRIGGITLDVVADPINLLTFGGKGVVNAAGATQKMGEGLDLLKLSDIAETPLQAGEVGKTFEKFGDFTGPTNAVTGVPDVMVSPGTGKLTGVPEWFNFPRTANDVTIPPPVAASAAPTGIPKMGTSAKVIKPPPSLDDLMRTLSSARVAGETPVARPKASIVPPVKNKTERLAIEAPELQAKLAAKLARNAVGGVRGWQYSAIDMLTQAHPGVAFTKTAEHLEKLAKNPNAVKNLAARDPARLKANLQAAIADDVKMAASRRVVKAETIANGTPEATAVLSEMNKVPGVLKPEHAAIAAKVAMKYEGQVAGKQAPVGMRNPEAYLKAISSNRNVAYSGPKQANMFSSVLRGLPQFKLANEAKRYEYAAQILNKIEESFIAKGYIPHSGIAVAGSVPLRLSEVMFAVGPKELARDPQLMTEILKAFDPKQVKTLNTVVQQAIEKVKAKNAVAELPAVSSGVQAGENVAKMATAGRVMSAAKTEEVATIAERTAQAVATRAGAGEVAAKASATALKDALGLMATSPIGDAIRRSTLNTSVVMANDTFKNYAKYSSAPSITRAIVREANLPIPRTLANKVEGLVPEWLGARFNAAYKNQDMRPVYLREIATAKSTVARRAAYLNKIVKQYGSDAELWENAFKGATGADVPVGEAAALSQEILRIMENLFGSSGLRKGAVFESTVAGRSQLLMSEINNNLKRYGMPDLQFTNKKSLTTHYGQTNDYSKGADWLNSWETWQVKNPIDFLYRLQNVVETTVREKIVFDDIVARWGSVGRKPGFTASVKHPRLNGFFFDKEIAPQITTMINRMNELKKPGSQGMQLFDKILSKWKSSVTIYMPGHHIRNIIGDSYFNWMAGVNSVKPYTKAINVMKSQKGKYQGLDEMGDLTSPGALQAAIKRTGQTTTPGGKVAFHMKNGDAVTNDMVYVSAYQKGLLPMAKVLEDIPDEAKIALEKFRPFGGRVQEGAHKVAETRDHFIRLAHYIDSLQKSSLPFAQATEKAAAAVRKWHPDGMDLTSFERNVMRRMFPFYSWTRKSIPLIVESILANPGKTMFYPKAMSLIQQVAGIDPANPVSDPFPVDQLFPDWIRDKGIGPVLGAAGNYSVINPSNPFLDLGADLNHPLNELVGGNLNPAAKIPAEVMTEESLQNQVPITDWTKYATDQVPGASHASRFTNYDLGGLSPKGEKQGFGNEQAIINFLTAMGLLNTGPYQKSAEFDLRDYLRSQHGP